MSGPKNADSLAASWLASGRRVVAATLVHSKGSAPLEPGATMLVDDEGHIEGSVTGGCVEGALAEQAQGILEGGSPVLRTFGISDSEAADVGLTCGGTVHIFVHELDPESELLHAAVAEGVARKHQTAVATLLTGDDAGRKLALVDREAHGGLGHGERLDRAVIRDAEGCLAHGYSTTRAYGAGGETMGTELVVFIRAFAAPAKMIVVGAIDFSAAIAPIAQSLGYEVHICDARRPFVMGSRFSVADQVVVEWPDRYLESLDLDRRDAVLVFTHDPKFDEPALLAALASGAGYIGALGSRRTHEDRKKRLLASGASAEDLERIAAPCGLDIGARTPEETAISVLAEIISSSTGRLGEPLSSTSGRIHPPRTAPAQLTG